MKWNNCFEGTSYETPQREIENLKSPILIKKIEDNSNKWKNTLPILGDWKN